MAENAHTGDTGETGQSRILSRIREYGREPPYVIGGSPSPVSHITKTEIPDRNPVPYPEIAQADETATDPTSAEHPAEPGRQGLPAGQRGAADEADVEVRTPTEERARGQRVVSVGG